MDDHRGAWGAAWGVVATLFGSGAIGWWLVASPKASDIPLWPAYAFFGVTLIALYCVFAPLLRLPPWRRDRRSQMVEKGNRNITTHHQSGGTNVTGDVHVTVSAPQASVDVGEPVTEQTEQGYVTTVPIRLMDGYAAQNLVVVVKGAQSLYRVIVNRVGGGAIQGMSLTVDGAPAGGVLDPVGRDYRAVIVTKQPEADMKVEALVDVEIR